MIVSLNFKHKDHDMNPLSFTIGWRLEYLGGEVRSFSKYEKPIVLCSKAPISVNVFWSGKPIQK